MKVSRRLFVVLFCAQALALGGCLGGGSSSGGGGGNGGDAGNGDAPPPGNGSGGETAQPPVQVFSDVAALSYPERYSGATDWADITPVYGYEVEPAEQPQRVIVDTLMLGHTMASALHAMDQEVLRAGLGRDADFYDFLELEACEDPGTISISGDGTGVMDDYCIKSEIGADRRLRMTGSLAWTDSPELEGATRKTTFENLAVDVEIDGQWRAFEISGAVSNRESASPDLEGVVLSAWDAHYPADGTTFRFYRRWSVDFLQFDELAFHPEHGALTMVGDGLYDNGDACDEGGRSGAAALALAGSGVSDATAQLYISKSSCGVFYIDSSSGSVDSSGDFIRPELYARFQSLFPTSRIAEFYVDDSDDRHFELTQDQSGAFEAAQPDGGRFGRTVSGSSDWEVHQIALDFDMQSLYDEMVTSGRLIQAQLRLGLAPDGIDEDFALNGLTFVTAAEWSGDPGASEFVDPFAASGAVGFQQGIDGDQPWAIADITDFVAQALDEGRTRLQLVIYASSSEPMDPATADTVLAWYCLDQSEGCDEDRVPSVSVTSDIPFL